MVSNCWIKSLPSWISFSSEGRGMLGPFDLYSCWVLSICIKDTYRDADHRKWLLSIYAPCNDAASLCVNQSQTRRDDRLLPSTLAGAFQERQKLSTYRFSR